MPSAASNESPGEPGAGERTQREQAAKMFVTETVDRFANETARWLQDSAAAFNACFDKALQSGYTADEAVKDMAGMWRRNVEYLARLANVSAPERGAGASSEASSQPGEQPPSAQGQA